MNLECNSNRIPYSLAITMPILDSVAVGIVRAVPDPYGMKRHEKADVGDC